MGIVLNSLSNKNFAQIAKKTAVTVYLMTGVKAVVRPMFIMGDKKNDQETKKYTATKEVLYQILCLGAAALMIPFAERIGFGMAEKQLSKLKPNLKKLSELPEFSKLKDLKWLKEAQNFKKEYLEKSFNESFHEKAKTDEQTKIADEAMHIVNGGVETGSFIASILGLTLLAPMISHEILHPIMHAIGMDHKVPEKSHALQDLEQPILLEGYHKVDTKA